MTIIGAPGVLAVSPFSVALPRFARSTAIGNDQSPIALLGAYPGAAALWRVR